MFSITTAPQASSEVSASGWCAGPFSLEKHGKILWSVVISASTDWATRFMAASSLDTTAAGEALPGLLLQWGLGRLRRDIRAGRFNELTPPADDSQVPLKTREADEHAIPEIVRLLQARDCRFKFAQDGELYCSAASPHDETVVGSVGLRRLAPTSESLCQGCNLPAGSLRCSYLGHVRVTGLEDSGGCQRMLAQGFCARGQGDHNGTVTGKECGPFESACWTLLVSERTPLAEPQPISPTAVSDALDFLDATWQLAFHQKLLRLTSTGPITELDDLG